MAVELEKFTGMKVNWKEGGDGTRFYYIMVGEKRVWVSSKLVEQDKYGTHRIRKDAENKMKLEITSRGGVVLKPGDKFVGAVFVWCGYRGDSEYNIVAEHGTNLIVTTEIYHSPHGSLGVSSGFIFEAEPHFYIKLEWKRTGRTYGAPKEGTAIVESKGVLDIEEDIDELKQMLEN